MELDRFLLWCGVIGGPLFIVVFLVEGALRPGYNAMRAPVSALALGERGWVQRANFMVTGLLMLACALGLPSALQPYGGSFWGPLLIGSYAIGLIGAGVFVTDVTGDREEPAPTKRDAPAVLHDLFSLVVFLSLFAACFVFARLFAASGAFGWAAYSVVSGILFGVGFVLFARGFAGAGNLAPIGGLLQRLTIAIGWFWISLVAAHLLGVVA